MKLIKLFLVLSLLALPLMSFASVPTGTVVSTVAEKCSPGYLAADGQTLTAYNYPELFSVIGYKYGGSDYNFKLPDLRNSYLGNESNKIEILYCIRAYSGN